MSGKLIMSHTRDIFSYIYRDKIIYRIPIYFKEEQSILQKANYIELTIPPNHEEMSCKVVNLYKESIVPVKNLPDNLK